MEVQKKQASQIRKKRHGNSTLGAVLIVIGTLWILKEMGWQLGIPVWETIHNKTTEFIEFIRIHFSQLGLPIILLVAGLLLISGRRGFGFILLLLAALLVWPHLIIPGILAIIFFPVLLIIFGVILLSKLL